jgi:protein TonB
MDLGKTLIESNKAKSKGQWKTYSVSLALHGAIMAAVIAVSLSATEKVAAEEKPMPAFLQAAAPPPPPPPPPPAARASSSPSRPKPQVEPIVQPTPSFVAPVEIPKEVPKPTTAVTNDAPTEDAGADDSAISDEPAGVLGGVTGGVVGGEVGGTIGGEVGGQVGGVVGGQVGGVVGGTVGGTGTEPAPAPPAPAAGPMRVGGDVKAPIVSHRVDPEYTEPARRARVSGVVIVEAIIDKQGNVDQVKVIRGLPMGLSESAERAVRSWKFKPGTLAGQPVDVIFNLTVVFRLGADSPSITKVTPKSKPAPSAPVAAPTPAPAPAPAPVEQPAPVPADPEPPTETGGGDPASPPGV